MVKKFSLIIFIVLATVSTSFAGEERIISEGDISAMDYTSVSDAMFDRVHMCSYFTSDCKVPGSYTLGQPRFNMRFWAPATQAYARHYLISDAAGTLVTYELYTSTISYGWSERIYDPIASLPNGDYIFTVIWQGTVDVRAAMKSSSFAVR
ncbi:MAG: hypothetical protein L0956_06755 [Candidatus Mariimomonas ferrooxydans]